MNAPILSFRINTSNYGLVSSPYTYYEQVALEQSLPVLQGEQSSVMYFRVYNNYGLSSSIATALNLYITTFDAVGIHTTSTPPITQKWIYFSENGFGENSNTPGSYTVYQDTPTAVGGSVSTKFFTYGSDGGVGSYIRAGSSGNGVGFLEVSTYANIPIGQSTNIWQFSIVCSYEWSS